MGNSLLKSAELRLRRWLLRRWEGSTPVLVSTPAPVLDLRPGSRVLFLRQDRIGDVLVSLPLLRSFHRHFPEVSIELLLGRTNWDVRRAVSPYVERCWRYEKTPGAVLRLLSELRSRRYDVIVDLMDNPSVTSSLVLTVLPAGVRVGIAKGNEGAYTHVVPLLDRSRVHIVERLAQLLLPFGIDPAAEDLRLEYPITAAEREWARALLGPCRRAYRVGVNVAASHPDKTWSAAQWSAFLRELARRHPEAELLLFAAPAYARAQAAIAAATGVCPVPIMPSFHQFAILLEGCDIIVTPDTAAAHLAAAWQRPCVVLHVWDRPDLMPWLPYRSPHEAAYTRQHSLRHLPIGDALDAFERLLHRLSFPVAPR